MGLYSFNGQLPKDLPAQYLDRATGVNYTALSERNAATLSGLGFKAGAGLIIFGQETPNILVGYMEIPLTLP